MAIAAAISFSFFILTIALVFGIGAVILYRWLFAPARQIVKKEIEINKKYNDFFDDDDEDDFFDDDDY